MTKADDNGEATNEGGEDVPESPTLGRLRKGIPSTIHALGDLHGWAPGLINYLISHKLAEISIDGVPLGEDDGHDDAMSLVFGESKQDVDAGLRGMPNFEDAINGNGHGMVRARWIASDDTCFVQIGDVFDRADHSELAAEILRQLIIDAPNRVFVLVGNHEQFMLENSDKNWYMNEVRNALTDPAEFPEAASGKHTRFFPNISFHSPEERALQVIFPCYRLSTFTLFLTQAAAQQDSGFIDRELSKDIVEGLLSEGWGPYNTARAFLDSTAVLGAPIPGALAALVIGENLFHHAEPGVHLNDLPEMVQWEWEGRFGWVDYIQGGSIQKAPHSPFLWTREACNGALNGTPRMAGQIDALRSSWPGLYRIIHGHSPTVGVDEFTRAMERGIEATTCSYLGESQSATAMKGSASGIRVYNIDEAMSPVYYRGSGIKDSFSRVPLGLRVADDSKLRSPVILHSSDHPLLTLAKDRGVTTDTRELWSWKPGQFRLIGKDLWQNQTTPRGSTVAEFDDSIWIVSASQAGAEMLTRRISGYDLIANVVRSVLKDSGVKWPKPENPPSSLKYITSDELGSVFDHLSERQGAWKTVEKLGLSAMGFKVSKRIGSVEIITICCDSKKGNQIFVLGSKIYGPIVLGNVETRNLKMDVAISIGWEKDLCEQALSYWKGESDEHPPTSTANISYWPQTPSKSGMFLKRISSKPFTKNHPVPSKKDKEKNVKAKKKNDAERDAMTSRRFNWPKLPKMPNPLKKSEPKQSGKADIRDRDASRGPSESKPKGGIRANQKPKQSGKADIRDRDASRGPSESKPKGGFLAEGAVASSSNPASGSLGIGRRITNHKYPLHISLDNEAFNKLLAHCGINKRRGGSRIWIVVQQKYKDGRIEFIIHSISGGGLRWTLESAGTPSTDSGHGVKGKELEELFNNEKFKEWVTMCVNETRWSN